VRRSFPILLLLSCLLAGGLWLRADDFQSWQRFSLTAWHKGDWEMQLHEESRWNRDSSRLNEQLITPQILWQANEIWRFSVAYTYYRYHSGNGFDNEHRLELEANPHWKLTDWVTLDLRNRLEVRFRDGPSNGPERTRHRIQYTFPLAHAGPLKSLYFNDEFFLDLDHKQLNQNRLTPLGLSFKLNDYAQLRLYYLVQSIRTHAEWDHAHVLGTQLQFQLK
jgi:hypothetical protein